MKIKTSELQGAALDWAVAKCEGHEIDSQLGGAVWCWIKCSLTGALEVVEVFKPSADWEQGGPIIEREKFCAPRWDKLWQQWHCFHPKTAALGILGPTPLIAAMRCYVTSKIGDKVDIPEELL